MNTRTRSLLSSSWAHRKPARPNLRKSPLDLHDLHAQLRGDRPPDEREPHDWATSWWLPVLFLAGLIGLVVLVLHWAAWLDAL